LLQTCFTRSAIKSNTGSHFTDMVVTPGLSSACVERKTKRQSYDCTYQEIKAPCMQLQVPLRSRRPPGSRSRIGVLHPLSKACTHLCHPSCATCTHHYGLSNKRTASLQL